MSSLFRSLVLPVAVIAAAGLASPSLASPGEAAVKAALASPSRADQQGDDARRKTEQVLDFAGVKPGQSVIDFLPGSGYWTRIFTNVVGPKGHVFAIWPAWGAKYAAKALPALEARKMANVTAEVQSTDLPSVAHPVDLFWTVQNYHDINNNGGEAALNAFNAAVFKALKPGGIYMIIDHADTPGSGLSGTSTKHRIDKAAVIREVTAAGFKLAGESTVLTNPNDDHTKTVFDPSIRGETDQFVLKFRKSR
ncbi:class I SAM-dependent methyltransferase [Novosphingobium sp. 9]|uniref:class I SAM-dependent methyltransferase n=1 Tax=Novosphingobium sp. 9 TaxID=2025349 RepID=UPI0021B5E7D8|nr:methyltransferase [Novosphingobium sp. 9]